VYDAKPGLLREQSKFIDPLVRSFEDHLKATDEVQHPSIRRIMPSSKTFPASFFPPDVKDSMYAGVIHETYFDMKLEGRQCFIPQCEPSRRLPNSATS
jgi:hypothetical protein